MHEFGLGYGLPTSYSLSGSSLSNDIFDPGPCQLQPLELMDDISPTQMLPSPILRVTGLRASSEWSNSVHSVKLYPTHVFDDMSPIESLSSPLLKTPIPNSCSSNDLPPLCRIGPVELEDATSRKSLPSQPSSCYTEGRTPFSPIQPCKPTLRPALLSDDMSPINALPSPLITMYSPDTLRHGGRSPFSPIQPCAPLLKPVVLSDAMSPINTLPSPLIATFSPHTPMTRSPSTPATYPSCYINPLPHQRRPPQSPKRSSARKRKNWSFGLGIPSAINRIPGTMPQDQTRPVSISNKNVVLSSTRNLASQNVLVYHRQRNFQIRPPPPSTPSPVIEERFISRLSRTSKQCASSSFLSSRLHSIHEGGSPELKS